MRGSLPRVNGGGEIVWKFGGFVVALLGVLVSGVGTGLLVGSALFASRGSVERLDEAIRGLRESSSLVLERQEEAADDLAALRVLVADGFACSRTERAQILERLEALEEQR
jgi:hypothetical protein